MHDQAISITALKNWEASVNEYLADLQTGIEVLACSKDSGPESLEQVEKLDTVPKVVGF